MSEAFESAVLQAMESCFENDARRILAGFGARRR